MGRLHTAADTAALADRTRLGREETGNVRRREPPPVKGQPNPISDHIDGGRWMPAFRAQDEMLDRHMKKYNLQEQDWHPNMYEKFESQ
jgi:hypothetical protein